MQKDPLIFRDESGVVWAETDMGIISYWKGKRMVEFQIMTDQPEKVTLRS